MKDSPSGPCLALKALHKVYVMKPPFEADGDRNHQDVNATTRDTEEINLFEIRHENKLLLMMKPKFKISAVDRAPIYSKDRDFHSNLRNAGQVTRLTSLKDFQFLAPAP
jgi:hypothetical protein